MNRRGLAANFASGLAGLAAASRARAAVDSRRNSFYLLEAFQLQQGSQRSRLDEFYTNTLLPALNRFKIAPPLILESIIGPHTPELLVSVSNISIYRAVPYSPVK